MFLSGSVLSTKLYDLWSMIDVGTQKGPSVHSWILNDYRSSGCDKTPKSFEIGS